MRYRLVLVTDGREGLLERTLDSFLHRVTPQPSSVVCVDDSADRIYGTYLEDLLPGAFPEGVVIASHPRRLGFCDAVATGWKYAAGEGLIGLEDDAFNNDFEYVYWLEDDFLHSRGVDLRELAFILDREPHVAQMALYRNPVNREEVAAGGYMNVFPEAYARRGDGATRWWETERCFTTNPSLFRRTLAAEHSWPTERFCEGLFGFQLREQRPGTTFGIWGDGTTWVEHIGVRAGKGY